MDILYSFVNILIKGVAGFFNTIISFLPSSPFSNFDLSPISEYLGYLNWLIPIGDIMKIVALWLVAIGSYYIYSIALRWVKAIE